MPAQPESQSEHPIFKFLLLKGRFDAVRFNSEGLLEKVAEARAQHREFRHALLSQFEGKFATLAEWEDARRQREECQKTLELREAAPPAMIEWLTREHSLPDGLTRPGHLDEIQAVSQELSGLVLRQLMPGFKSAGDIGAMERCRSLMEASTECSSAARTIQSALLHPAAELPLSRFLKAMEYMDSCINAVAPLLSEPPSPPGQGDTGPRLSSSAVAIPAQPKQSARERRRAERAALPVKRPVPTQDAAAIVGSRSDLVLLKLYRAGYRIGGTERDPVADLDHIIECYPKKAKELRNWADRDHPAP